MGAVHLFYDPDFKDRNDFRNDLRKIALSPGPGAHKDPLNSFKFVINQNGKYSIPKVSLFPLTMTGETSRLQDQESMGLSCT